MSGIIGKTNVVMTALCVVTLTGCVSPAQRKLDQIADRLIGSFSSAAQAEADPDNYFDIRLRAVRIWPRRGAKATEHSPGYIWLYVEQAAAAQLDRPYRQRVYLVSGPVKGEYRSDVYLLPGDPLIYAGAWADPVRFEAIRGEDLELRSGCTIYLELGSDDVWRGATRRDGCASELRGAKYATSEVEIFEDELRSWDRGWDAQGQQVWGATKGPYRFVRQSPPQSSDNLPTARR